MQLTRVCESKHESEEQVCVQTVPMHREPGAHKDDSKVELTRTQLRNVRVSAQVLAEQMSEMHWVPRHREPGLHGTGT